MTEKTRTEITPELILSVCEMVAEGQTLSAAAKEHNTSPAAIRYRLMNDADLFSVSLRARESGCDALADQCIEIADNTEIDPANKRIMIETRIRLIGKWSKRYSDKVTVTNETTVTHKYDLDSLGTDRLEQLEAILADARRGAGDTGKALPAPLH